MKRWLATIAASKAVVPASVSLPDVFTKGRITEEGILFKAFYFIRLNGEGRT